MENNDSTPSTTYFADEKDEKKLYGNLKQKVIDYHNFLRSTGRAELWRECAQTYYAGYFSKGQVVKAGDQGEKRKIYINHVKNLLQNLEVLTLSSRPMPNPRAINSDYDSQSQCILARNILDYYRREKRLEQLFRSTLRQSLIYGEGHSTAIWDETAVVDGQLLGDIDCKVHMPHYVVRDPSVKNSQLNDWYMIIDWQNKFQVAAKYPKLKAEIVALGNRTYEFNDILVDTDTTLYPNSDMVPVYYFWHKKNNIMPNGKQVIMMDDNILLNNMDLPYDNIPVYSMQPDSHEGKNFGYTVLFDLLSSQKVYDGVLSAIISNINAFGLQNILNPAGNDIDIANVTGGLRLINYKGDKAPEAMRILAAPPELYTALGTIQGLQETISGVNSVVRGDPQASLKSGAALALVESMTVRFNSALQQSYVMYFENFYTGVINLLKHFADNERQVIIAGKINKPLFETFKKDDLSSVSKVLVDMGNPMQNTDNGRREIADMFFKMGVLATPDEYMQVYETGHLDPLIQGKRSQLLLIADENEKLKQGIAVPVVLTDDHYLHIRENAVVLSSVEARLDETTITTATKHLQAHINILRTADPDLLKILGQESLQKQAEPKGNGEMPGAEPMEQPTGEPTAPMTELPSMPNMPNFPTNPSTGEQWSPDPTVNAGLNAQ